MALKVLYIRNYHDFFANLIDIPSESMVIKSTEFLQRLNALDENYQITPLGLHLAKIPVEPQIGKMILMGSIFSCFDPITSIAATLSYKSPFYNVIGWYFLIFLRIIKVLISQKIHRQGRPNQGGKDEFFQVHQQ